jgi:hypothetical protein
MVDGETDGFGEVFKIHQEEMSMVEGRQMGIDRVG